MGLSIINKIDLNEANISLKSNGIVYVLFKDNTNLDSNLQLQLLDAYNLITNGRKMPFIFFAGENVSITKEARNNARALENLSPFKSCAVVVANLSYKLIANFYLNFHKPSIPYRVFKNENEALKWLENLKL